MYHRIAREPFDPWALAVTPEHFREHLAWLSQIRTVLRLQDFVESQRRGALPSNAIALTFDDGYACNSEVAAPLLEQFRIPATIFLPARLIETGQPFWWDELEDIVFELEGRSFTLEDRNFPIGERHYRDRCWAPGARPRTPRQAAFRDIHARLMTKKPGELQRLMDDLRRQARRPQSHYSGKRPMTREQARRIGGGFVEFGSHTLTHPWLPALDPKEQTSEISDSLETCRALTGVRPIALAYPFGAFDENSQRLAQQAGLDCACSTEEVAVCPTSNIFALPRVQVGDCSAAQLARRLAAL